MQRNALWTIAGSVALLAGCVFGPSTPRVHYACESGTAIDARYPAHGPAIVAVGPRAYAMRAAPSLIGRRYENNRLQWRVDGRGTGTRAILFTPGADGRPGEIAERCHEVGRD